MDNKTMILNRCNFVGKKIEVNVNEIENETLGKLTNIKKIVLNGSKVKDQKEVVKFFKDRGIESEFYEKNLPIG